MISKYNLATISPDVDGSTFNAATGGTDILFDWTPMLIPNGTCVVKSLSGTIMGTNGAAANGVVRVALPPATSSNMTAGLYHYDLEIFTTNDVVVKRLIEGKVTINQEVTR